MSERTVDEGRAIAHRVDAPINRRTEPDALDPTFEKPQKALVVRIKIQAVSLDSTSMAPSLDGTLLAGRRPWSANTVCRYSTHIGEVSGARVRERGRTPGSLQLRDGQRREDCGSSRTVPRHLDPVAGSICSEQVPPRPSPCVQSMRS